MPKWLDNLPDLGPKPDPLPRKRKDFSDDEEREIRKLEKVVPKGSASQFMTALGVFMTALGVWCILGLEVLRELAATSVQGV